MMKYDCYGCKYAPYNIENSLCTRCGKYIPSEDGDSTVYVYVNWTPKDDKKIKCDLCEKIISYNSKITMKNKINNNTIDICKECFNEFFNKSDLKK